MAIVFLVGGRGAGKTTVGRALARELGLAFTDMDEFLCARAGQCVADIVAAEGWEGFRRRECTALREAAAEAVRAGGGVIATGGGAVLDAGNREFLRQNGVVVWLALAPETAAGRLAASPLAAQRPSLTGKGMLEELREVMVARAPLYAACAHHTVDAAGAPASVCGAVLRHLKGEKQRGR